MRIGLLTGGGDCPGLNAVIRAVVRKGIDSYGDQLLGFRDGWRGVLEGQFDELTHESIRGILPRGGTILGSSRTNPFKREDGLDLVRETLSDFRIDGLIAIGGEGTPWGGSRPPDEGIDVVGGAQKIDKDPRGTHVTVGFDPPLSVGTGAIHRLH